MLLRRFHTKAMWTAHYGMPGAVAMIAAVSPQRCAGLFLLVARLLDLLSRRDHLPVFNLFNNHADLACGLCHCKRRRGEAVIFQNLETYFKSLQKENSG